ncbi:MAG TPA: hypothetical protein VFA11_09670 [Acidimicrobiales bacterium]|nr:hypothetical protein [Acidimicrobiales bacterium]
MSGLTPAEVEQALQTVASVGGFLYNVLSTRRGARPQEFSELIDELVKRTVEEVGKRLLEDDRALQVVEAALDGAARTGNRDKRRLLAQVAAAALEDDADIDLLGVMIGTVDRVDPIHIRVLVLLANPDRPGAGQMRGYRNVGPWHRREIEQRWPGDPVGLDPVLSRLQQEGLVRRGGVRTGMVFSIGDEPEDTWAVTGYGEKFLRHLPDDAAWGSGP